MDPRAKVLLVDDDGAVLRAIVRELREAFDVTPCNDPAAALLLLKENRFALVLTDYRMTPICGTEILRIVKQDNPSTIRVLMTASPGDIPETELAVVDKLLDKPWAAGFVASEITELLRTLRDRAT